MTYFGSDLLAVADRIEAGAKTLRYEAENAAEVLAGRAGGDRVDPTEWAAQKTSAADAAEKYAAGLRQASEMAGRVSDRRYAEAERVARAAECGGILIDTTRLTESAIEHSLPGEEGMRRALRAHQDAEDTAVRASGQFQHVAETINGVEQVPYWQLGARNTNQVTRVDTDAAGAVAESASDDDCDEA